MSIDVKMAWRNIGRNPRRTVLTISAIAFASLLLVFMLSLQFGSYDAMINASVKIHTGHLQVQAEGYQEKRDMRLVVENPQAVGRILERIPEVEAWSPRANGFSLVSSQNRTYGILVNGIDPEREARVSTLKSLVRKGAYLSEQDRNQALVGRLLAENLRVGLGDELTVLGQGRDGSIAASVVTVKGIFSSGMDDFDRSSIAIPLADFQDVYFMRGAAHEVVALGRNLADVQAIKGKVKVGISGIDQKPPLVALDWSEIMPGLLQAIQMDLVSGAIFYLILILVVAFSIMNTFLMAIFERTREFGVLMAIGTTPGRLTKLLLIESMSMTGVGIVIGIVLGCLLTLYYQSHGLDLAGSSEILEQFGISGRLHPRLSVLSALAGPAVVLIITFLAALWPALKVRGLRPVEAMTHV